MDRIEVGLLLRSTAQLSQQHEALRPQDRQGSESLAGLRFLVAARWMTSLRRPVAAVRRAAKRILPVHALLLKRPEPTRPPRTDKPLIASSFSYPSTPCLH